MCIVFCTQKSGYCESYIIQFTIAAFLLMRINVSLSIFHTKIHKINKFNLKSLTLAVASPAYKYSYCAVRNPVALYTVVYLHHGILLSIKISM